MRGKLSRITRAAGATVLASVLIVGPLGLQGANAEIGSFNAHGESFALRVTVDYSGLPDLAKTQISDAYSTAYDALPAAAQAELPDEFPFVIDQYFALTESDASNTATLGTSVLGKKGDAENALGLDLESVSANAVGQNETKQNETVTLPPAADALDISAIDAVTGLLKASVVSGPRVDGEATIARVGATLSNVTALLPAELQAAFQTVVDGVNTTLSTADNELDAAIEEAAGAAVGTIGGTPLGDVLADNGIVDATDEATQITQLITAVDLPQITNPLDPDVDLAAMTDISSVTTAQKTSDGKSAADAVSQIKSVDVLDGFLSVGLINLAAHSEADGTAGSASNTSACSIADVRLGDTAGVSLDGSKLYVEVDGEPVAVPVGADDVVADLKGQVDAVLAEAGFSVKLCEATNAASPAGDTASQTVKAFEVSFAPVAPADIAPLGIAAGDELVRVTIDPTVQTSVAAAQAAPAPAAPPATLPRTGPAALLTVLSGLGLAGAAMAIRRRMQ